MTFQLEEDEPAPGGAQTNDRQVGGSHYRRLALQPWDLTAIDGLDVFQHEVCAYVIRWRAKGGLEDLRKAMHWLAKYLEVESLRAQLGDDGMRQALLRDALAALQKREEAAE